MPQAAGGSARSASRQGTTSVFPVRPHFLTAAAAPRFLWGAALSGGLLGVEQQDSSSYVLLGRSSAAARCTLGENSLAHPGFQLRANLESISHRCHFFEVAFVWELTQETIHLPLGCLQGRMPAVSPAATCRALDPCQPQLPELSPSLGTHDPHSWLSLRESGGELCRSVQFSIEERLLYRNVQRFRDGLVFKAHRLLHHSALGLRVIKKKKESVRISVGTTLHPHGSPTVGSYG